MRGMLFFCGALFLCLCADAFCELIAYDGFDEEEYPVPETVGDTTPGLKGVNGGSGWADGWTITAPQYLRPGRVHSAEPGLSMDGVPGAGLRALWDNGEQRLGRQHIASRTIAGGGVQGDAGERVWFCFLHRRDGITSSSGSPGYVSLKKGAEAVLTLTLSSRFKEEKWTISAPDSDTVSMPSAAPDKMVTGAVIVRIDFFDGPDSVYVWAGEDIDLSLEPDTADAVSLSAEILGFDGVEFAGAIYCDTSYDEIRIATSFYESSGYKFPGTMIYVR